MASGCGKDSKSAGSDANRAEGTSVVAKGSTSTPAVSDRKLEFKLVDYGFEGPSEAPAGTLEFEVSNPSNQLHQLTLVKPNDGVTYDDLEKATHTAAAPDFEKMFTLIGGVNAIGPSEVANTEINVDQPGDYALVCFIPDAADGKPHWHHAMIKPFTITKSDGGQAPKFAKPDATFDLSDFKIEATSPTPLHSGKRVIEFDNKGTQPHEAIIVKLNPGKGHDDLLAYFGKLLAGQLTAADSVPGVAMGGPAGMAPGRKATVQIDLEPGKYALFCAISDPMKGNMPHVLEGMYTEVTVE